MGAKLKFVYLLFAPLLGLAWLVPNHYLPWAAFYNEMPAALALLALAVALFSIRRPLSLPYPAAFVLLLALVPLLQFGFGLIAFLGDAVVAASYLAGLGLSIVVGANLARAWGARFVEGLAWVCLVGALISVVLALHQWLGLELGIWLMDMPPNGRPYANLAQPNNLATLFALGLIATVYLRERGHFGTFSLALLALLLFSGIAMTRSRMAIFVVIVIAGWILWGRRRFALKSSPVEVWTGVGVFALLWGGWGTISEWLYLGADSTLERVQNAFSSEVRLLLWQQLLDAVWLRPFSGYGWNQVSTAQIAVVAGYPHAVAIEYGHNLFIDLLVWNGVLLGGLLALVMVGWLLKLMRQVDTLEPWFALLFVMVILTHGMFELPHAYAYFLLPAGLCIGIVSYRSAPAFTLPMHAYVVSIAMGVGVAGWIAVEYQRIATDYRLMRFETFGIERRSPEAVAPDVLLLTQLEELVRFARTEAEEGMAEEEIRWMGKVAHRYPYPPALMRYALALGLNHRAEESALELRRLKQIQPADRFEEVLELWPSLVARYPQLAKVSLPVD